jgi:hypothetical protein
MEISVAKASSTSNEDGCMFDGELADIVPDTFVSFMYSGFMQNGLPFNPQISYNKPL